MPPITTIDDPRYVKAMSHPLRVRILALLDERTASPVELAGWLGATLGTVAYHVRTLERMGLIELMRETRVRGAVEHHYRATERPSVSDEAWATAPPIAKQAAVSGSLEVSERFVPPPWVGSELTGDKRYANQSLALEGRPPAA